MVNLDQICKIEEFGEFFRLYLISGDVEEVDRRTFISAVNASGAKYMRYQEDTTNTAMVGITDDDIEDMTNLSDNEIVPESSLSSGEEGNAHPELKDVTLERLLNTVNRDKLIEALKGLQ